MTDHIIELERDKWQDHLLEFRYISHYYYDVEVANNNGNFKVSFIKKPFDIPYVKTPHDSDRLFQPYLEKPRAWGIIDNGQLIAAIETHTEEWSNRLIVSELWVHDDYRRKGIASALMNFAVKRAKDEKRRALKLETQSCNEGGIAFYLNYGFNLIGFDTCAYQNDDIARKEVRMELGMLFDYD